MAFRAFGELSGLLRAAKRLRSFSLLEKLEQETGPLVVQPPVSLRSFFGGILKRGFAAGSESESLEEIRSRIFGMHIGNNLRSGRKLLRGKLLGPQFASWYPQFDLVKSDPFMLDFKAERYVQHHVCLEDLNAHVVLFAGKSLNWID